MQAMRLLPFLLNQPLERQGRSASSLQLCQGHLSIGLLAQRERRFRLMRERNVRQFRGSRRSQVRVVLQVLTWSTFPRQDSCRTLSPAL